ncbi:CobW family GTP-binding protein [Vulgatibacter sp.]|uniref:CobW family GTP-binding protein n=1 Tax=Vulgatibacter sp. TaxID=1971226 RepID=UPI003566172E
MSGENGVGIERAGSGPLPVVVVTGFLGSGKTTLLRSLLGRPHGMRIGLVLNELGQAGIDVPGPTQTSTVELTEGCVCCLRNPDLLQAMEEMHARGDVDRVIIETTGLADPLALTWTLARQELHGKVRVDAVIAVVDPTTFEAARSEEWEAQVRAGDLVVLSKLDVATPEQRERAVAAVRAIQPEARVLEGGESLPVGILLDAVEVGPRSLSLPEVREARHSTFQVVSVGGRHRYRLDPLEDWLEALPEAIFRAKGIVELADGSWAAFHVVGGRLQLDLGVAAPAHGESRFAFFGRGLEKDAIEATLLSCRVE